MTSDITNKMKQNIYHTVGTFIKSSRKITERGKIHIHIKERSLSCHNTGTSIKSGSVKVVVWVKTCEKKMSGDNKENCVA